MQKWEYATLAVHTKPSMVGGRTEMYWNSNKVADNVTIDHALYTAGEMGWELVSTTACVSPRGESVLMWCFKRPKADFMLDDRKQDGDFAHMMPSTSPA